ncbi:MAG: transposase [Chloroflexi bacterium]|nr:transposase [Chloroflexota bacterium]
MKYQKKGHGDYVLVLTDLKGRIALDILPDRQKKTLVQWLTSPPAGIVLTKLVSDGEFFQIDN